MGAKSATDRVTMTMAWIVGGKGAKQRVCDLPLTETLCAPPRSEMRARSTIAVLRVLLDLFERFGRPRFFRTDNESIFSSPILSAALWALGVRHQLIDPFCP